MRTALLLLPLAVLGCTETTEPTEVQERQIVTTIEVTIDGTAYTWDDPENDGLDPIVDPIVLPADASLPLSLRFFNALQEPAEELTERFRSNADFHQVFYGTGQQAGFTYTDTDSNGLPLGLSGTLDTSATASTGELRVILRHMPVQDDEAQKVAGLEDTFYADGETALPGSSGADVTFELTIDPTL